MNRKPPRKQGKSRARKPRQPPAKAHTTTVTDVREAVRATIAEQNAQHTPAAEPDSQGTSTMARAFRGGCIGFLEEAEPQAVAPSYRFEAPTIGRYSSIAVRFTGTRTGVAVRGPRDHFEQIEHIDNLPTDGGKVAITAKVQGIASGEWRIVAEPLEQGLSPAGNVPRRQVLTERTRLVVLAHGPGVRPVWWPVLVGLGAILAIVVQAVLASRAGLDVTLTLALALVGSVLGFAGAKIWYLVLHRRHPRTFLTAGACIQGFLVGAFGTLAIGSWVLGLTVGTLLDVTAPGLFLGMAVGRPGCLLSGCCAGRPTNSRWGLWSSDRRLAVRRHPVQLAEAALALVIGVTTLSLTLTVEPGAGALFAGAAAAYTFGRQLLFPLRSDPHTRVGRAVTMVACGLVLAAAVAVLMSA